MFQNDDILHTISMNSMSQTMMKKFERKCISTIDNNEFKNN